MNIRGIDRKAIQQFIRNNRYVALIILAGLLLLLWPGGKEQGRPGGEEQTFQSVGSYEYDLTALERKLTEALSQVEGAGKTHVVLTLSTAGSVALAENRTEEKGALKTDVVIIKCGSGQEGTVEIERQYPVFLGALVICEGGGNAHVKLEMLQAVKALTGLRSEQISICERSGGEVK